MQRVRHDLYQEPDNFLLTSRVTVELSARTGVKSFTLSGPPRIVFDLGPAAAAVPSGTVPVNGTVVQAVRWAVQPGGLVRVVVDVTRLAPYRALWLDNPTRLVIDVDRLEVALHDDAAGRQVALPFDDYLAGVLAAEVPVEFQPEALKAQVVAARTYALRRLRVFGGPGCTRHPGADLCADPAHCQGYHSPESLKIAWKESFDANWSRLTGAVAATRQLYLAYGSRPAEAVYHSTCGGHTASALEVWGSAAPYLGGVPCEYCQVSPLYRETRHFTLDDLAGRLGAQFFAVTQTTPSGRAAQVVVAGKAFGPADLRARLGLSSTVVEGVAGDIAVTTRGFGHGVGLCQWGAEGQARLGRTFREILYYYYPGTALGGVTFGGGPAAPEPSTAPQPDPAPSPAPAPQPGPLPVVVLDPGHGGTDPGAVGVGGLKEKTVNLAVALALEQALTGRATVCLTRRDDSTVSLQARTDLSNAKRAALFVSVHCNAATAAEANGTETYHYPGSRLGTALATYIQQRLVASFRRRNRGVKEATFYVLHHTDCPAALAELLFITNPAEAALLAGAAFQRQAAEALAAGILDYLAKLT